mmetsp:Transcript_28172/g.68522  ORF Transcript_28172/g.68522 Transcript_28172/m.68522 type:complete len:154 (+) Transcript_28172:835-1296(+)
MLLKRKRRAIVFYSPLNTLKMSTFLPLTIPSSYLENVFHRRWYLGTKLSSRIHLVLRPNMLMIIVKGRSIKARNHRKALNDGGNTIGFVSVVIDEHQRVDISRENAESGWIKLRSATASVKLVYKKCASHARSIYTITVKYVLISSIHKCNSS